MNFFNQPYKFSFKDMVALMFIGAFLFFCLKALHDNQVLELVKTLVSLIGIILGGYFVQEGASMYFTRNLGTNTTQQQYYGTEKVAAVSSVPVSDPVQVEQGEAGPL